MSSTPTRTCVVCRKSAAKDELVRVVFGKNGLELDLRNRLPGRGAYIHRSASCGRAKGLVDRLCYSISKGSSKKDSSVGSAGKLTTEQRAKFDAALVELVGGESGKPPVKKRFGIGKIGG